MTGQPPADRRHHGRESAGGRAQRHEEPADGGGVEPAGAGRGLTGRQRAHRLDVELRELAPQVPGEHVDALGVGAVLLEQEPQFAVHDAPFKPGEILSHSAPAGTPRER